MEANPGGAPCNVLAMLTNLGKKTAFIGKVGDDMFGRLLKDTLIKLNINAENLILDKEIPTTLAFVRTNQNGDRDFSFYRRPGAGDAFFSIAIRFVLDYGLENMNMEVMKQILAYANAGASLVTTRRGALCVMPTLGEIEDFLKRHKDISV